MNLANDVIFCALLSILVTFAVWLLEKLPWKWTTDGRPYIAQGLGALCGLAYSFPSVYSFLNKAPLPDGATPASYIVGGWWAGLAAIGMHQAAKRAGLTDIAGKVGGTGLLVVALAFGSVVAGVTATGCASRGGTSLGDVISAASITQNDARKVLTKIQSARVAALQAFAIVYVTAPSNPKLIEAKGRIDAIDAKFRQHWDNAAAAVDDWNPSVFVREYTSAQDSVAAMKAATPKQ